MCLYSDIVTVQCTSTYKTTLRGWFLKWGIFIVALFQRVTSHSGTLSKWHFELLFRIKKNDFIIVALNQWELRKQGWGRPAGEVRLKYLDNR